jgi:hypothetical protein
MSVDLYYTAPSDEVFEEIRQAAIRLWQTYDNQFGYVDEKVNAIKDIANVGDNWMYMVAMFDDQNQGKLFATLKPETVALIREAIS